MPTKIILWATLADDVVAIDADGLTDPVYMPRESAEIMVHWINERLASDYTVNQMIDLKDDIAKLQGEIASMQQKDAKLILAVAELTEMAYNPDSENNWRECSAANILITAILEDRKRRETTK